MNDRYDQTSPADIERHGKKLVGKTLRTQPGAKPLPPELLESKVGARSRAAFGTLLERYYYGIQPGNESAPDFPEAGVELKSTPLKRLSKGGFSAKERLVLNLINYEAEAGADFSGSSFMSKNAVIMLVSYEHGADRAAADHPVRVAGLMRFADLPEKDRLIIQEDWRRISSKIRAGKAHELHEGETEYLSACTKAADSSVRRSQAASGPPAKPRAYSFKAGFMTGLLRQMLDPEAARSGWEEAVDAKALARRTFEEEVLSRFEPFIGRTAAEITGTLAPELNPESKDYLAALSRRIIGVKGRVIEEFEKAEIAMKTVQLDPSGMPQEDASFPAMRFKELAEEEWDAEPEGVEEGGARPAAFKRHLSRRFLLVAFRKAPNGSKGSRTLEKAMFWTIPHADLEGGVRQAWEAARNAVRKSDPKLFPKKSQNPVSHVRPHARNAADTDELPNGTRHTKQGFWLDKKYIRQQLRLG